jgi:hypothetical protein
MTARDTTGDKLLRAAIIVGIPFMILKLWFGQKVILKIAGIK